MAQRDRTDLRREAAQKYARSVVIPPSAKRDYKPTRYEERQMKKIETAFFKGADVHRSSWARVRVVAVLWATRYSQADLMTEQGIRKAFDEVINSNLLDLDDFLDNFSAASCYLIEEQYHLDAESLHICLELDDEDAINWPATIHNYLHANHDLIDPPTREERELAQALRDESNPNQLKMFKEKE